MKNFFPVLILLTIHLMSQNLSAQTPKELADAWDESHITSILPSNVRHRDVKDYLEKLKTRLIKVKEVGRSYDNREIYQIEWGKGPTKVLMWSQMHGDEPTATSALIDIFAFLQSNRNQLEWVSKLEQTVTIRAVPMLNPDGAVLFRRRNLQGIDINRDARALETPEAAVLMKLRNEFLPDIGFNLHNQGELTTVGGTARQATISVLAVRANPNIEVSEGQKRNDRICSLIVKALDHFINGNIARYDDRYTEKAFGDTFSDLGTPVILIETGGAHGRDEMFLTKLNFIAIVTALQSLADSSEAEADVSAYSSLPFNSTGRLNDYIFREATIVNFEEFKKEDSSVQKLGDRDPLKPVTPVKHFMPYEADIALNRERRRAEISTPPVSIRSVGDLSGHTGLSEFDSSEYYVLADNGNVRSGFQGALFFFKKERKIDWNAADALTQNLPDAIFSRGKWLKGEELFGK